LAVAEDVPEGSDGDSDGDDDTGAPDTENAPSLFPPGPLATLSIQPPEIIVQAGRERRVA
jgi:hypothetical protein